jgi:hypothetical protein
MRVNLSNRLFLAAATLLPGCNSTTGPRPTEELPGVEVLTVHPSLATVSGGRFIKLRATMTALGNRVDTPPEVIWSSSDTNVATVGADGIVEGRKAGRVQIVATWQAARGSAVVVVLNQVAKKPLFPQCLKRIPAAEQSLISDNSKC